MSEPRIHENRSGQSGRSDLFGIVGLFRSDLLPDKSDRSGQRPRPAPAGPTGPTGPTENERTEAGSPNGIAAQCAREARPAPGESEAFPYGTACNLGDTPRTWNGHIVSLAKWHRLSEWEKHGPNGWLWCGLCRCWHMPGDCTGGET